MYSKILKKITNKLILWFIVGLNFLFSLPAFADSDDLSDVMSSVKSDFGTNSTFIKLLYLLEIIAAVYGYHKSKNIGVLIGIVVISIFINFALGHWVFTS